MRDHRHLARRAHVLLQLLQHHVVEQAARTYHGVGEDEPNAVRTFDGLHETFPYRGRLATYRDLELVQLAAQLPLAHGHGVECEIDGLAVLAREHRTPQTADRLDLDHRPQVRGIDERADHAC